MKDHAKCKTLAVGAQLFSHGYGPAAQLSAFVNVAPTFRDPYNLRNDIRCLFCVGYKIVPLARLSACVLSDLLRTSYAPDTVAISIPNQPR
jgi:hypothetical protein